MACLRMGFNKWLDNEPEISDDPSEDEEQEFKEAAELHGQLVSRMAYLYGANCRLLTPASTVSRC